MQPIIYDVAVSLDGFISGPEGDVSQFAHDGPVVDDYASRMGEYTIAIMGRKTYEFGYDFGLAPGQNPYPNMETFIFSQSLSFQGGSDVSVVPDRWFEFILKLKSTSSGPIYLCGGGEFAGWMLERGMIDEIVLKRAPCTYGDGVALFGNLSNTKQFERVKTKTYDNGYLLEQLRPA